MQTSTPLLIKVKLIHLETHYEKVNGDHGVIDASSALRTALPSSIKPLSNVNGTESEKKQVICLTASNNEREKAEGLELEKSLQNSVW